MVAPQQPIVPQQPVAVQNVAPAAPAVPDIPVAPAAPAVPQNSNSGWENAPRAPPVASDVANEGPSATAVPPPGKAVPQLPAEAFGDADLSKKPPLKDFSAYQYATDFERVSHAWL